MNGFYIATILRQTRRAWEDKEIDVFDELTKKFANMLKHEHPNFDSVAFYEAAGICAIEVHDEVPSPDEIDQDHSEETRKEYDNALGQTRN